MNSGTVVTIRNTPVYEGFGVELRMIRQCGERHLAAKVVEWEPMNQGDLIPVAIKMDDSEAQKLCDELWKAGFRPRNGEGSTGQLAAMKDHLQDLRKICFKALGVK